VKRRELVKKIEEQGAILIRHDGKHGQNPTTKFCQPVPRHNEINEHARAGAVRVGGNAAMGSWRECGSTNDQNLARSILRRLAKS
jgi:hypothetical protein